MYASTVKDMLKNNGLTEVLDWLESTDYFTAPASSRFHGAKEEGLVDHSYLVSYFLSNWTISLGFSWERLRSSVVVGLLHDVCKVNYYEKYVDESGIVRYRVKPERQGCKEHGSLSVKLVKEHMELTQEEEACILYHMGTWTEDIDPAIGDLSYTEMIHKYPNVLWTHTADMYASQVIGR